MMILLMIGGLALAGVIATLRALPADGYRRVPTDPKRLP